MERQQRDGVALLAVAIAAFIFFWYLGARGEDFLVLGFGVIVAVALIRFANRRMS